MGMFNDNKILTVFKTEPMSETDLIARYNLGAYDSVEVVNGITTITRATGYVDLGSLDWHKVGTEFYTAVVGKKSSNAKYICSNNMTFAQDSLNAIYYQASGTTYENMTASEFKTAMSGVLLQFELVDNLKYTEQVIPNQPLNTLDQNGSQWLRNEWEKGLNLWNLEQNITFGTGASIYFTDLLKPNTTYTISTNATSGAWVIFIDNTQYGNVNVSTPITFTTPNSYTNIFAFFNSGNSNVNFMLVEGDHAYPYQPYYGEIVRESDITDFQNQLNGKQATLVNQQNIKSINGINLLGSGNLTLEELGITLYMNVLQLKDSANDKTVFRIGSMSSTALFNTTAQVEPKSDAILLIIGKNCGFKVDEVDTDFYYGIVPPEFKDDIIFDHTGSFNVDYHDLVGISYNDGAGGQNDFNVCFLDRATGNITTTTIDKDDIGDTANDTYYFEVYSYLVN